MAQDLGSENKIGAQRLGKIVADNRNRWVFYRYATKVQGLKWISEHLVLAGVTHQLQLRRFGINSQLYSSCHAHQGCSRTGIQYCRDVLAVNFHGKAHMSGLCDIHRYDDETDRKSTRLN